MHGSIPGMQSCAASPISVALSGDTMGAQNLRAPTVTVAGNTLPTCSAPLPAPCVRCQLLVPRAGWARAF